LIYILINAEKLWDIKGLLIMEVSKLTTTIAAGFSTLKSNLEITGLQKTTVASRQSNVRDVVANGLDIYESFLAGSYARSTMISPLKDSDVDIFILIEAKYYHQYSPAALLDKFRTVLKKEYPATPKISRNGQAVTITFTDFKVDVVPSFYREGGGYLIPDSINGSWISTDPTIHHGNLTDANKWHDTNLIPVIKMIKAWNRCINDSFYGFYLELLTKKVLTNVNISNYPSAVRYVFDKGREAVKYTIADPAGFGDQVRGLKGVSSVKDAQSRFETAYNRALKAEEYAAYGNIELAYEEWRKIFPNYFPAYR
jgi:hypothetical protein